MKTRLSAFAAALCFAGVVSSPAQAVTSHANHPKKRQHAAKPQVERNREVAAIEKQDFLPFDPDVPGKAFVSTGPYVGVPYQYAGGELIVNSPSVNTDVQLLQVRKSILGHLQQMGGHIVKQNTHSHLLFSGFVEGVGSYFAPGGSPSTSSIDLGGVGLDAFFIGPSDWTLGYFELNYENVNAANDIFTSTNQYTVSNSRVFVNRAFITVGNFQKTPFYGTVGQFFVPFGVYSSVMVSAPLTKTLTRTKARSLLLGFQQQDRNVAWYGAGYIFRGDSHANSRSRLNNGGLNVGFKFKKVPYTSGLFKGRVGAGVIANIADSQGMQALNGFARNAASEQISRRIAGYNFNALFSIGKVDFITEYVTAATEFNVNDMGFNGRGAKPSAIDLEAVYSFDAFDRPNSVGIGYSATSEAMSLGIPLKRYSLVFNTSIWAQTLQSLEFRRDQNYAASVTGNGANGVASTMPTGKGDNAVNVQFDYYF